MADGSIDSLSIEVSSNTDKAVTSLTALVNKLGNVESKLGTTCPKLASFNRHINALNSALSRTNLSGLKDLSSVKVSSTVPKNLGGIADAVKRLPVGTLGTLQGISNALSGLKGVSLSKSTVNNLRELPSVFKEYEKLNMSALASQIGDLNRKLGPLAINVSRLSASYKSLPTSMRSAGRAARTVATSNKYLDESNKSLMQSNTKLSSSFNNASGHMTMWSRSAATGLLSFAGFSGFFDATIGNVNSYIENMNLFEASMGKFTQSATEYGMKVQDALGIDFGEWARNQGVFQTLMTGMGETADRAAVMSQQMTQLGYDIASFYNLDVDTAMLKIQSGIAGELEPLRRLGWDLSNARMQLEATKLGIDKSVQSMTQAEKVGLRYHLIMTQVTQTHGDMARTIMSPANQLRVLKSQITLTARAIGNLFIPILNAVLPYAIAFAKAIRICAEAVASFFGLDIKFEVDYSTLDTSGISTGGTDDLADSLDNASKKAKKAKKSVQDYKNTVMGFDELNKLNDTPETNSGSGSGSSGADAGGGAGFELPLETYDFLAGLKDNLSAMTDEMAQNMVKLLPYIGAVASGLAAWKIGSALGKSGKVLAGIVFGVAGAVQFAISAFDAWNNGVDFDNLFTMLGGLAMAIGGVALVFGPVAAALTAIVGGIAMVIIGFHDFLANGPTPENTALVVAGILAIGAALSFIIGGPIALIVAAVVAAVAAIAMNWDSLSALIMDVWNGVCDFFIGVWNSIVEGAALAWQGIQDNWSYTCDWFYNNLIKPVGDFFGGLWDGIVGAAQGAWNFVKGAWNSVASWFNSTVIQPVSRFFSTLWSGVTNFAQSAWSTICSIFSSVSGFIGGVADSLWNAFKGIINRIFYGINGILHWIFGGINQIITAIKDFEVLGMRPFSKLPWLNVPHIPYLAEGRYGIPAGQLFVARESGAEMVGSMGGHTTVANNDQIVEGIEAGVYNAVVQALAVMGGGSSGASGSIDITLELDGEVIARKTLKNFRSMENRGLLPQGL